MIIANHLVLCTHLVLRFKNSVMVFGLELLLE
jgi:hypothetical protein